MSAYTYNDLIKKLNESRSLDYLKKMEKASRVDDIIKSYDSILNCRPSYEVYFWKNSYIPVLYTAINANIIRAFKETTNPSEEYLLKSLVNLRGDYNQAIEYLIKEAINNKNLSSAKAHIQEALNIKRRYDNAWSKLLNRSRTSIEHQKSIIEISSLLKPMKCYGYIHTREERKSISYYELNKTENFLKIAFGIIAFLLLMALIVWAGPLLLLFGAFIGIMLLKCMR